MMKFTTEYEGHACSLLLNGKTLPFCCGEKNVIRILDIDEHFTGYTTCEERASRAERDQEEVDDENDEFMIGG